MSNNDAANYHRLFLKRMILREVDFFRLMHHFRFDDDCLITYCQRLEFFSVFINLILIICMINSQNVRYLSWRDV